ncbi:MULTISPECIES: biopolymer transporter ExbD [Flavobacterium]|jgi:biopolymer transport protein ExbD|uniref:Biopolymer transport protein ExbD/TolR n=1 Tax=Flavobacterium anhuiense TaxID=459526 RepID=A0AAC9D2D8_9FLAO|nr:MULTISPECIES: biopolymer transporter ExbD [Flavobacterium]AOC95157.1 Biopolymer transport protein ExbD/TolR [Flavobacterium anhuiense]MXO06597.1 biopolymer transporter ExbD [Flavobacterium sp. HBTb2-11-1]URM37468.1 biopolymer transporter ExbD [Flavobacterium anhuiense]SCY96254.1 Biopolymer transport protein ExbD/TolR [Flavobacterium anhuiense]
MAKIKMKKKSTSTDMTAMCDVAFLLLTFFILTATAKVPEALPVDTPASTVQTKLPDTDLAIITVGKGKVFFDIKGREIRKRTLEGIGAKYGINFSEEDKTKFALMDDFGVPVTGLKQIIDMKAADRTKANQPGIPLDSLDNQLKEWLLISRRATIDLDDKELQIAIKGDAKEEYPKIKKIMDILQDQKINSFNLVTGTRGKDF